MKKWNYVLATLTFIGFLILRYSYESTPMQQFDQTIAKWLFGNKMITAFHYIGDTKTVVVIGVILIILLWLKQRNYRGMLLVLLTFAGGQVFNQLLKKWVQRPRPDLDVQLASYSFPSGHTMTGMLFLFTIAYFITEAMNSKRSVIFTWILTGILVFFIGLSRIAEGRHYATDVLGGWLIAYTFFVVCIHWYERRKRLFKKIQNEHLIK